MDTVPIEILRVAFSQSVVATMTTQLSCYLRLVAHPDLQYADLLDALARNAVIADDAANRLQRRFNILANQPIQSRAFWEDILTAHSLQPTTPFTHLPTADKTPV